MPKKEKTEEEAPLGVPKDTELEGKDSVDEKSELVEILDENEEDEEITPIDENKFREFFGAETQAGGRASAAVLEEVTAEQEGPRFIPISESGRREEDENDSVSYSTGRPASEDSKYDETPADLENEFSDSVITNIGFAGTEARQSPGNNVFVTPESREMDSMQNSIESSYVNPKRFEKDERLNPIEKAEKKYKEFKP